MEDSSIDPVEHRAVIVASGAAAGAGTAALVRRVRDAGLAVAGYRGRGTVTPAAARQIAVWVDRSGGAGPALPRLPAPALLYEAARTLGALPHRTVVIDDSEAGILAARAGGFALVIGVDRAGRPERLRGAGADAVVSRAEAIPVARRRPHPVTVREIGGHAELRITRPGGIEVAEGVADVVALARRAGLTITGPPEYRPAPAATRAEPLCGLTGPAPAAPAEFAVPIAPPPGPVPGGRVVAVEPGQAACTGHLGEPAHRALDLWLDESRYRARGPRSVADPLGAAELRVPVAPATLLTATRPQRPAQVTAELIRLLPEHGFELLSLTTPDLVCAERTLLMVRHPILAAAACAADRASAAPLLTGTVSVRGGDGGGSVVDVLDPVAVTAALGAPALTGLADRLRYLLAATLCAVGGAPAAVAAPDRASRTGYRTAVARTAS